MHVTGEMIFNSSSFPARHLERTCCEIVKPFHRGAIIPAVNTGYIDLEFGQIYGSYRRDFVPVEVGMLIHRSDDDNIIMRGSRFEFNGEVVLRKNSLDSLGNSIGLEERVYNPKLSRLTEYDPHYRESRRKRLRKEPQVMNIFASLGDFCRKVIDEHEVKRLVFFGGQEDRHLLARADFSLRGIATSDLQKELHREVGDILSLDKTSIVIRYHTEGRRIRSRHFEYVVPEVFRPLLRPHKAVGDAARTFLLDREFGSYRKEVVSAMRRHMKRIKRYREQGDEIPIF